MVTIRKAYATDFESIYTLLHNSFPNPNITKQDWNNLFVNHWRSPHDHFGYILVNAHEEVVGFLGTIFSKRIINGAEYVFCNQTSWVVDNKYKGSGVGLLLQSLKDNGVITNLSPIAPVSALLSKIGFRKIESHLRIVLPVPSFRFLFQNDPVTIILDKASIEKKLAEEELTIFRDHTKFKCIHVLIKTGSGTCYCIMTKVKKKKLPFGHIHFVSNPDVFAKYLDSLRFKLAVMLRIAAIFVDNRFLRGTPTSFTLTRAQNRFAYRTNLPEECIDNLYSEMIIFNN